MPAARRLREYIWLNDMPVAVVDNVNTTPVIYDVQVDHLMRPARMTDASANWVWDVIFTPFGTTAYINQNPTVMNIRFPGQWFQLETGLAYNWHRHYDATTGRYVQPDRLGLVAILGDGPSIYNYARQAPLGWTDRSGENAAGGLAGLGYGRSAGAVIGEVIDPVGGGVPGAFVGAAIGAVLGDWLTGPDVYSTVAGPFWDGLIPCKGRPMRTNGEPGKKRRYYDPDRLHGDLEVYGPNGEHLGSADPETGDMTKPPVPGRKTDVP